MRTPTLQLPFTGSWFVFWGGDTKELNNHHSDRVSKYALDMIILDTGGKSHRGSSTQNSDYYAYGQSLLAVADGVVIEAVDGVLDNEPNKTTNDYVYNGNAVLIKHTDGVYSLTAHLRPGSLRVKAGTRVKAGQKIGECGNSGNSTEAHVHFQLQDSATILAIDKDYSRHPVAKGLKAYFACMVTRSGKTRQVARHAPVKSDTIAPPPSFAI